MSISENRPLDPPFPPTSSSSPETSNSLSASNSSSELVNGNQIAGNPVGYLLSNRGLLEFVKNTLANEDSYTNTPEDKRIELQKLANNPNNQDALFHRLKMVADLATDLERNGYTIATLQREEIAEMAASVKDNFLLNIEQAYKRTQLHQATAWAMVRQEGSYAPRLETIELINGSDPHNGGKQACLLKYRAFRKSKLPSSVVEKLDLTKEYTLVYKPRNMEMEKSLIDPESGAFAVINRLCGEQLLPTYKIECFNDGAETFGLVEFIPQAFHAYKGNESDEEKSYYKKMKKRGLNEQERIEYYKKAGMLQFAAQFFGIGDLHSSNLIVRGNHKEGYMMYPIDLEVSYDPVVLRGGTTGLSDGLEWRRGTDSNLILSREGNTPRWRRGLADHPEDKNAMISGFKEMKERLLLNPNSKRELLSFLGALGERHCRYVPVATAELTALLRCTNERLSLEQAFLDKLREKLALDLQRAGGTSLVDSNQTAIAEAFTSDRMAGDVPVFMMNVESGVATYNGIPIATFPLAINRLRANAQTLSWIEIEEIYKTM